METYVDEDAVEGEAVGVDSVLGAALARSSPTTAGTRRTPPRSTASWVLVYGSAPADDLLTIVESLTDADL